MAQEPKELASGGKNSDVLKQNPFLPYLNLEYFSRVQNEMGK